MLERNSPGLYLDEYNMYESQCIPGIVLFCNFDGSAGQSASLSQLSCVGVGHNVHKIQDFYVSVTNVYIRTMCACARMHTLACVRVCYCV